MSFVVYPYRHLNLKKLSSQVTSDEPRFLQITIIIFDSVGHRQRPIFDSLDQA